MCTKRFNTPYNHITFFLHIIPQFGDITDDSFGEAIFETGSTSLTSDEINHLNVEQLHYMRLNIGNMEQDFPCIDQNQ